MKKMFMGAVMALSLVTAAHADYTFVVPQVAGSGTAVWTDIVVKHLEKHLGEPIKIQYLPGANDIPGFNKFHNELQKDDKTVMVSHGGNGVSYLLDEVDYDYYQYDPVGMMNLTIVNSHQTGFDPYTGKIKFAAGSGNEPDVMAHLLLQGGPGLTVSRAVQMYNDNYVYVRGMKSGGEKRLAYTRGELNVNRESTASHNKHFEGKEFNQTWFSHGVFNLRTGKIDADPNFPGKSLREVFKKKWGAEPSGEFWDAYVLARNFRDVLQKALWTRKNNPNTEKLRAAFRAMAADPVAMAEIHKDTGKYDWVIGTDMVTALNTLRGQLTEKALTDLVEFQKVTGKKPVFKKSLIVNRK
jgi:hypothetical protein